MAHSLLLADDSPTIARILAMALPAEDYSITSVQNAADAERKIKEIRPLFFLVDVALPEKDGLAFTRWVKAEPTLSHTKVIVLANAFDPVDESAFQLAGVDGIVVKPFDPAELRARLSALAMQPVRKMAPPMPGAKTAEVEFPAHAESVGMIEEEHETQGEDLAAPTTVAAPSEELTPKAQALAAFLEQEVQARANAIQVEPDDVAMPTPKPPQVPLPKKEVTTTIDLTEALSDWAQKVPSASAEPAADSQLSDWSRPDENAGLFDTGNSTFKFSEDYVERVTKAFLGLSHEESVKKFGVIVSSDRAPQPAAVVHPAAAMPSTPAPTPVKNAQAPSVSPAPSAPAAPVKPSTPSLSEEEVEVILRDEVRRLVREMFPHIAEKIVREELAKALKAIEEK